MATQAHFKLPIVYRASFLFIEPVFALAGAVMANFKPVEYLQMTHSASAPMTAATLPMSTKIVLTQLANLYLLFALNEALILRKTSDLRVWRTVLLGMLVADFGHLYSSLPLGTDTYWKVTGWNMMAFGNVGFVYAGACLRMAFLLGIGLKAPAIGLKASKKSDNKRK